MGRYMGQIMAECDCRDAGCETVAYCKSARIRELEAALRQVEKLDATLKEWAAAAGSTKTPRGRTLNAIRQRLERPLKAFKRSTGEGR